MTQKLASYKVRLISLEEKDKLIDSLGASRLFDRKASLHGACIKLSTDNREFYEAWGDSFNAMSDTIRPHGRIFALDTGKPGGRISVDYEPVSKTLIVRNCDYYGWIKSLALALAADFFEDYYSQHRRYSVHGSLLENNGRGLAIIGPSGTGKTTLTYGLMTRKEYNFIGDDWFFVRLHADEAEAFASEKNSYIRADLAKQFPEFAHRLKEVKLDVHERGVAFVSGLFGGDRLREQTHLRTLVLLQRDKNDKRSPLRKLAPEEALAYLKRTDFCNPHQLIRNGRKQRMREKFFAQLLEITDCYLLNTIETPQQSLERLEGL